MNKYGIIYKITNTKNGKIYIGQTNNPRGFNGRYYRKGNGIERVKNTYESEIKRGKHYNVHLYNSILKHGIDCWIIDEEFDIAFSEEELNYKEWFYIEYYKSTNSELGYNKREGGDSNKCTQETKDKISKNHANCSFGNNAKAHKVVCLETRKEYDSISRASIEMEINEVSIRNCCNNKSKTAKNLCWMYYEDYIKLSENEIEDIIEKKHIKETKLPPILKGKENGNSKRVRCVNTGEEFDCVKEAMSKYNIKSSSSIGNCCNGKSKHTGKDENGNLLQWEWI